MQWVRNGSRLVNPRMLNAVGTEWITPGLPRMLNAVGTEWITPGLLKMLNVVGTEWITPGLPRMWQAHCFININSSFLQ